MKVEETLKPKEYKKMIQQRIKAEEFTKIGLHDKEKLFEYVRACEISLNGLREKGIMSFKLYGRFQAGCKILKMLHLSREYLERFHPEYGGHVPPKMFMETPEDGLLALDYPKDKNILEDE